MNEKILCNREELRVNIALCISLLVDFHAWSSILHLSENEGGNIRALPKRGVEQVW